MGGFDYSEVAGDGRTASDDATRTFYKPPYWCENSPVAVGPFLSISVNCVCNSIKSTDWTALRAIHNRNSSHIGFVNPI
jgi:hypothetical protein